MTAVFDAGASTFGPHHFRWYTLEMCGLLTVDTPKAVRSSLNRAVRLLAAEGKVELSRARCPYDLGVLVGESTAAALVAELDAGASVPGRRLWFREIGGPPLFTDETMDQAEEWFPDDDVSWRVVEWYDRNHEEWLDFVYARDRVSAQRAELGRFLRWYLFGASAV
ncbi:MAG: hypothetical protein V7706_17750 [Dietzia psychralcaliphila]